MGFLNKLMALISSKEHELETPKPSDYSNPNLNTLSYDQADREQNLENYLDPKPNESIKTSDLPPILDSEWELYIQPSNPNLFASVKPSISLKQDDDVAFPNDVDSVDVDVSSDQMNREPEDFPESILTPGLPETHFVPAVSPPIVRESDFEPPSYLQDEHEPADKGTVFMLSSRRMDAEKPPRLSLALMPVAVPTPLSYALIYHDEINQLKPLIETEEYSELLIQLYENYLNLVPDDFNMWQEYSELLIQTRGPVETSQQLSLALEKVRDQTFLLFMLADVSRRVGDMHTAWSYIEILNKMHPNDIEILEMLRDLQRECKFFDFAQNTDHHIQALYEQQRSASMKPNMDIYQESGVQGEEW